ncbi:Enoyl-[acyl-carrier-protein] reductase [NADH] FabI [Planctomycetes bacterium Pan216]|uniref:Enoyl-[acyl-carrier-protein] reductase [NADH] n=1 Tax=Kolteria novifilia TaxID=2527975 RepID=A0A518B116_9BACT|nr:Enoyl-[acyl-carrier-protein] reductase [NADH] FabI [Planctomycetes bacterium Pan216]
MDYLQLAGKSILVMGVANRKSVAAHVGRLLLEEGAEVIFSVRSESRREQVAKLFPDSDIVVCDVERQEEIDALAEHVKASGKPLHGIVHSIAFANYSGEPASFHETRREDFLQAVDVSCYSLMAVSNAMRDCLDRQASVVTISISTTRMAAENYGYMGPIKAALDSSLCFLAKSFSAFSEVRFNAVCPGLLKTSASAGIPGYVDSYLFAEKVIPRGRAVATEEVANSVVFLLSPRSSGINAQGLVIDAAMAINYFDRGVVRGALGS